jgi:hypothetical protein
LHKRNRFRSERKLLSKTNVEKQNSHAAILYIKQSAVAQILQNKETAMPDKKKPRRAAARRGKYFPEEKSIL